MTKKKELLQILLDAWTQFAIRSYVKGKPHLTDAGLSILEQIRFVLVEYRLINGRTGLPPGYPTNETTGFAPIAPWRSKQQTSGFAFGRKKGKK